MFTKKMSARMLTVAGATALVLGGMSSTQAGTNTANLSVTASVAANCTIATTAVAFGAYDPVGTNLGAALNAPVPGKVSVNCTVGSSATVTLGQGGNVGAASTDIDPNRRMTDGAGTPHFLSYTLFSDAGLTTEWGNTVGTGVAHVGTGTSTDLPVYGTIPAAQNVPVGSYSDSVLATVTF